LPGSASFATMKMRKKSDLPQKTCTTCGKPYAWRKKWARDWENVRYCSERCRSGKVKSPKSEQR
jgi:hypothetical protein